MASKRHTPAKVNAPFSAHSHPGGFYKKLPGPTARLAEGCAQHLADNPGRTLTVTTVTDEMLSYFMGLVEECLYRNVGIAARDVTLLSYPKGIEINLAGDEPRRLIMRLENIPAGESPYRFDPWCFPDQSHDELGF